MSMNTMDHVRAGTDGGGIPLRATLVVDAISSGVLGVLALFARAQLTGLLGLSDQVLLIAGIILVAAAVLVCFTAAVAWQPGPLLWTVTAGNAAWVALSVGWIVIQRDQLTGLGTVVIAAQAVVVTLYVLRYLAAFRGAAAAA